MTPQRGLLKTLLEKGENAGNQHFLLFPQSFLPFPKQVLISYSNLFLSSANAFNMDQPYIVKSNSSYHLHHSIWKYFEMIWDQCKKLSCGKDLVKCQKFGFDQIESTSRRQMKHGLTLYHTKTTFDALEEKAFENIFSIFLFSHHIFYPMKDNLFSVTFNLSSANAFNLGKPTISNFTKMAESYPNG